MKNSAIAAIVVIVIIAIVAAAVAYTYKGNAYNGAKTTTYTTAPTTSMQSTTIPVNSSSANASANSIFNLNISIAAPTVQSSFASSVGSYLSNGTGWTLYTYGKDKQFGNTSACNGTCATIWPPFYTNNVVVSVGLNASLFGNITRSDGSMQTTYNGYPLYHYSGDKNPGNLNGQGYLNLWYVISPNGTIVK